MIKVTTRGKTVEIPSGISELSPRQYEYYCILAFALAGGAIDVDFFKERWFSFLIGMKRANFSILRKEFSDELRSQLSAIDDFFRDNGHKEGGDVHLDFSTPVNLLPEYEGYKGPGPWLEGLTYGEFVECLTIFESLNDADEDAVAEGYCLIARILYHIPREETVPDLLAFHAPTLFASVWREIQSNPIEINGRMIDFSIIFKSSGERRPDDHTGWTGITFEIASAGLFGSVKDVECADMWAVLIYLYKCKFEYLHDNSTKK